MNEYRHELVMDVFDYSGHLLCNLYDSSRDISGQATNIVMTMERNGWMELSFTLPSVCETANGSERNHRLDFLKADFRIRTIDADGTEWFLISEPRVAHQAFSTNVSVTAGHVSQILKTKNLGLEFSDDEGNNIGTAAQLLDAILDGTGWTAGNVDTFLEKDKSAVKKRSLVASTKTGAFKQITKMCELFDAKPVFHGDTKTVDILHMNPFSEPEDGGLPDISSADSVLEIHYGKNASGITRTLNTENLVTKLYAYGAYGDKVSGYCGIDEGEHTQVTFTLTEAIEAGQTYHFFYGTLAPRHFTPLQDLPAGTELIWSHLDPFSTSYLWFENSDASQAYQLAKHTKGTELPATMTEEKVQNWFSFLMDFSYYRSVGLLTDEAMQKVAEYQQHGAQYYQVAYEASDNYLEKATALSEIIGDTDFCKLSLSSVDTHDGYIRLNLTDQRIEYRTDYSLKPVNQFHWTPATELNAKGDPVNDVASIVYIIHNTTPVTWEKAYVKLLNDDITTGQDGIEQEDIHSITLWAPSGSISCSTNDRFYLFGQYNINGLLGAWEAADEAKLQALEENLKVVTAKHPVYFVPYGDPLPDIDANAMNGYGWCWRYDPEGTYESQMYFYFGSDEAATSGTENYATSWAPVYFTDHPPAAEAPAYWFNWAQLPDWDTATLYVMTSEGWKPATSDVVTGEWNQDADTWLKDIPFDIEDVWDKFSVVYHQCTGRDQLYKGVSNYYRYTITGLEPSYVTDDGDEGLEPGLPGGNYYFEDPYHNYHVFTTKTNLLEGSVLSYDAFNQWIVQDVSGVTTVVEKKQYPFDAVMYNSAEEGLIIINKDHYRLLSPLEPEGDTRGILRFIADFPDFADSAYLTLLPAYQQAMQEIKTLEDEMISILGDMYREGWWQDDSYVDGDETKLYEDAYENLKKIAQPEAQYQLSYLDRYGAVIPSLTSVRPESLLPGLAFATYLDSYSLGSSMTAVIDRTDKEKERYNQRISTATAIHLVDPDIDVNVWAYVDKLSRCYDQPSKSSLSINTNLTVMGQHSFTDVLTNIANVANDLRGKTSLYKRAAVINGDGILATERLEGTINAAKLKILGGSSTWYTDDNGNMVFESADGMSAMTLTGNGFALANSKDEYGDWNWRSFGDGNGFTADEIVAGFLSADRIQAASISSVKLDADTQNLLGWVRGSEIRLSDEGIRSTVTGTIMDEMSDDGSALRQSVIDQTAQSIRLEFNEALSDIDASKEMQNNMNAWFDFSGDGLKIGAEKVDGTTSQFYTKQNNQEYSFWQDTTKLASITGEGMSIPQVTVTEQFRIGNLYAMVEEDGAINWVYKSGSEGG